MFTLQAIETARNEQSRERAHEFNPFKGVNTADERRARALAAQGRGRVRHQPKGLFAHIVAIIIG